MRAIPSLQPLNLTTPMYSTGIFNLSMQRHLQSAEVRAVHWKPQVPRKVLTCNRLTVSTWAVPQSLILSRAWRHLMIKFIIHTTLPLTVRHLPVRSCPCPLLLVCSNRCRQVWIYTASILKCSLVVCRNRATIAHFVSHPGIYQATIAMEFAQHLQPSTLPCHPVPTCNLRNHTPPIWHQMFTWWTWISLVPWHEHFVVNDDHEQFLERLNWYVITRERAVRVEQLKLMKAYRAKIVTYVWCARNIIWG